MTHIIGQGREITKDYNEIYFHEDDDVRVNKLEMWMAKKIGERLVKDYPNRQWNVNVDVIGGMVVIMCPSVSHNKGYHLHIKGDTINALEDRAVQAAGEILERYGLSRDKVFNPEKFEDLKRVGPQEEAITADSDGINPIINGKI